MAQAGVEYGQKHSITGCIADSYGAITYNHFLSGDYPSTIEFAKRSLQYEVEPFTYYLLKGILAMGYTMNGQYEEAQIIFDEILKPLEESGFLYMAMQARLGYSLLMVMKGNLSQGIRMLEDLMSLTKSNENWIIYCHASYMLGKIYLQMIQGEGEKSFSLLARNIGFLIKTIPFLKQKAEEHYQETIRVAKKIGTKGTLGQAYLDMGELRKIKGSKDDARKYITDAIPLFEECENDFLLKQAREALSALG
jgi:tetratricopeptide (TPR) repeat protein